MIKKLIVLGINEDLKDKISGMHAKLELFESKISMME